jgi:lipid II:glycine glycyltransferase (peptidoglycan interpeptide bridge formation enzyme)
MEDITVRFTSALISIDDLDKLEYTDSLISVVKNTVDSITAIAAATQSGLNPEVLDSFLKSYLRMVNLENLFFIGQAPPPDVNAQPGAAPAAAPQQELYKTIDQLQSFVEDHKKRLKKLEDVYDDSE